MNGCLIGAVALFAILLVAILVLAVIRFSSPPEPVSVPQSAPTAVSMHESLEMPATGIIELPGNA